MARERFFNTEGPVNCEKHYCLDPLFRIDISEIIQLVAREKYFVLHAPRQTGKTTCLLALMDHLNREGTYTCLYINVETGQSAREDVARGIWSAIGDLASRARDLLLDDFPVNQMNVILEKYGGDRALSELLSQWCASLAKPLVLLIDEVDSLIGDTLISVLRQIRSGYDKRPAFFPQSIILCGVRDVRDYRIHSAKEKAVITGGSAFNIKAKSLRLGDFTREEVESLYLQHTEATGQVFEPDALSLAWDLSEGQPWLVNALAYQTCFEMKSGKDRSRPITKEKVEEAKEALIMRRVTHLDQLSDKLQEERVRRVIGPMLHGQSLKKGASLDDIQYCIDLGLIRRGKDGPVIANGIYREVLPRELTYITQLNMEAMFRQEWYILGDGSLDMPGLLAAFQEFFREHSEHWIERFQYREAGPQLLMQAFLQRIVNGGGRVEREYGLGRMRTDLLVKWPFPGGTQKAVIELKLLYKTLEKTIAEGLVQTRDYMDRCGVSEGHLVIFDRTIEKSWEEKIFRREATKGGAPVTVWGM